MHLVRRLPVPRPREVRRRGHGRATGDGHENVTLLVNAEVVRLETDAIGRTVTGVVVSRDGGMETYAADIVVVSAGASNSAKILLASRERPASERPRERLRPGRTQLHVPQQQGGRGAVERAERHGLPEDPRRERLLLRRRRLRLPGRPDPDGRQVERRGDEGRGAGAHQARPALEPRRDRAARRRLLAHDGGPARSPTTGSRSTATATSTCRTDRRTTRRPTACTTSSRRSSTMRAWPTITCWTRTSTCT